MDNRHVTHGFHETHDGPRRMSEHHHPTFTREMLEYFNAQFELINKRIDTAMVTLEELSAKVATVDTGLTAMSTKITTLAEEVTTLTANATANAGAIQTAQLQPLADALDAVIAKIPAA